MKIAYSVNLQNGAVTRYTHWPFTHMGRFQGQDIAVDGSGIYRIGGDTAAGANIDATARIDGLRISSDTLKRIVRAYVAFRPSGDLDLSFAPDEGPAATYRLEASNKALDKQRVKPGRGPKGVFWSVTLANVNGGGLDVESLQVLADSLPRRIG
ncbi:hypothetical protein [Thiohalorhabdus sp.]|uniref:hypothetical protein n=1 Tax=Thiohalorhabdus sp. TaxID=3094134 RepID=UPI002FC32A38